VYSAPQAAPSTVVVKRFSEIPVEMATGEWVQREAPDLRLKSRGLMLEVARNYRSRRESAGPFGFGWEWNHGEHLEFPGDFVILYVTPDATIPIIPDVSYTSAYARVCLSAPSWGQGERATGAPDAIGGYGNVAHFYGAIASLQPLVVGGWDFLPPAGPSTIIQVDLTSIGATAYDFDHPQLGVTMKLSAGGSNAVTWGHHAYDFDYVNITSDRPFWSWADVNAVQARLELASFIQNVPMDVIADTFHLGITYTRNESGEYKYLPGATFTMVKTNNEYWINNHNKTRLVFGVDGKLLRKTDANGNSLTFQYDDAGRLIRLADALDQTITCAYENTLPGARIIRMEDHLGRSVGYAYSGDNLVAVTNVLGDVTRYAYAETESREELRHNLVCRTDPEGHAVRIAYYTTNSTPDRVCRFWDGDMAEGLTNEVDYLYLKGTTYSWRPGSQSIQGVEYNASNDISHVYIREGDLTYQENDGINLVANHPARRVYSPNPSVWENIEGALGSTNGVMAHNPTLGTNSSLEVSAWGFNVPGMSNDIVQVVLSVRGIATNPVCLSAVGIASTNWSSSHSTWVAFDITREKGRWTWADVSNLTARISLPSGAISAADVWLDGFSLKVSYRHFDPGRDPQDLFYYYDLSHNLVSTDRGGCVHQFAYDARGNLVAWTDPEKHTRRYEYDPILNKPVRSWDALGRVTTMEYDPAGRLIRTTDALGQVSTLEYDRYGNVVRTTDAAGAVEETIYDVHGLNVVRTRNRRGYETAYDTDAYGNCIRITAPDGGSRHASYNAMGWKIRERDEAGVETRFDYDRNGRLTTVATAAGTVEEATTRHGYDGRGQEVEIRDPLGRAELVEYNADGRVLCRTDRMGGHTVTEYDENGNPCRITDSLGQTSESLYDERGNVIATFDRRGLGMTLAYDGNNNPVSSTDKSGNRVVTTYDANGNKITETFYCVGYPGCSKGEIPEPITMAYEYDALNRLTNTTVGVGRRDARSFSRLYNAAGFVVRETDPMGMCRAKDYDANGNVTNSCLSDAAGRVISRESAVYDSADRLVMEIRSGLATNRYDYDSRGLRVAAYDSNGRRTAWAHDRRRRLVSASDPEGTQRRMAYDLCGNKVAEVTGTAATTGYEWDAAGRLIRKISGVGIPDARVNSYTYDRLGRLITETDPLGQVSGTAYDEEGNVIRETNKLGSVKTYFHDAAGRVTNTVDEMGFQIAQGLDGRGKLWRFSDKRGCVTASAYDVYGRLIRITDALGNTAAFTYDSNDNKVTETDPRGLVTRYGYDAANRVTNKTVGVGLADAVISDTVYDGLGNVVVSEIHGTATSIPVHITRRFDPAGNLVSLTDARGAVTRYVYDGMNRQISEYDAAGGLTQTSYDDCGNVVCRIDPLGGRTRYGYDAYGLKRSHTDAIGATTRYDYDRLGRLTNTVDALGGQESKSYDADGNLVRTRDKNGAISVFDYDRLGRLTNTVDALGYHTRKSYDAAGNVLSEIDKRGNGTRYIYDALNRIVSMSDPASNTLVIAYDAGGNKVRESLPSGLVTTYGYDRFGRRVVKTVGAGREDARRTRYEYDFAGRITAEIDPRGGAVRTRYDANGNKIQVTDRRGVVTELHYDALNRLVQTVDALGKTSCVDYDAMGRIVRATNRRGASTVHEYDAAGRLISLRDAEGNLKSNRYDSLGRLIEEWEPNQLRTQLRYDAAGQVTNRMALAAGGECRGESYQYDPLGRRIRLTDALGAVTALIRDANGNVVTECVYSATGTLLRTKTNQFDARNQPVLEVDALGSAWRTDYDAMGRKTAVIDPYGNRVTTEYNIFNEPTAVTDPLGYREVTTYDGCGRETLRLNALGQRTRYHYDPNGNRTTVLDDNGNAVLTAYDPLNRVSEVNRSMPEVPFDVLLRADVNGDGVVDDADVTALEEKLQ